MTRAEKLFNNRDYFKTEEYKNFVVDLIQRFYMADLGVVGDLSAKFVAQRELSGTIYTREKCTVSGLEELEWAFPNLQFQPFSDDGQQLESGDKICQIVGEGREVLAAERTILNILSLMSGISTNTKRYVEKFSDNGTLLACTRKTIYGAMDKKAVMLGGAATHRISLADAVIIKDTHLDSYGRDLARFVAEVPGARFVEIEVETADEAYAVAELAKGHINIAIMLDNFEPREIKEVVEHARRINSEVLIEASGGVNYQNISDYSGLGLDILSSSSLNRELKFIDLTFKVDVGMRH